MTKSIVSGEKKIMCSVNMSWGAAKMWAVRWFLEGKTLATKSETQEPHNGKTLAIPKCLTSRCEHIHWINTCKIILKTNKMHAKKQQTFMRTSEKESWKAVVQ